jgi:DNA-directed RNA polymerase specialized sigma24 family protein
MSNGLCRPATGPAIAESFDEVVLPHLNAAYRLAIRLMRNEHDAEDVVQEASLRAFDTSGHLPAEMGVPGSSELFATPVVAGAARGGKRQRTRSMKSGTAPLDQRSILRR